MGLSRGRIHASETNTVGNSMSEESVHVSCTRACAACGSDMLLVSSKVLLIRSVMSAAALTYTDCETSEVTRQLRGFERW